jgi:hypothetical protein
MTIEKPPQHCRYPLEVSVKMFWVGGWIHGQGFWDQIFFGKSDESLVRLAKAFCQEKGHVSCVRIQIRDVGKGSLSKRRYPYVTIIGLGEKHDEC